MISRILYLFQSGLRYVQLHPQFLFVIGLIVVLPLLFLFFGNELLKAVSDNQTRLLKDRIGILNDVIEAQLTTSDTVILNIQSSITEIASKNPDILKLRVLRHDGNRIIPIAALDEDIIGKQVEQAEMKTYLQAFAAQGDGLIFRIQDAQRTERWQSFRGFRTERGDTLYIFIETTLETYQALSNNMHKQAYSSLAYVYALVLGLAYWLYRSTDYRYLYLQAQEKIQTKDTFMNLMVHELRAPLTAMKGYASLIAESPTASSEHKEYAQKIQRSTERLVSLINDVLEVARIQSGKLQVSFEEVSVNAVVYSVAEEMSAYAKRKNLDLFIPNVPDDLVVISDHSRLHQVLVNIVSNSIKYTDHGTVKIEVEDRGLDIEIRVKDTGVGIHAEDQKQLFAPFFRVQNNDTQRITGSGLGMWITKQLTELFGGSIGIESMSGVGTTVVLTIPKKPPVKKSE